MSWMRPRELLATFGRERLTTLCLVYVFCLGSALAIGSTQLRGTAATATVLWTVGALVIALVARASFLRFAAVACEIRLPDYGGVLQRSHASLLVLTLALPIASFWFLIPEGRYWICLTLLVPLGVQVSTLSSRFRSCGPARRDVGSPLRGAATRSSSHVIRMFIGRAYTPLSVGSRAFTVRVLCVVLWSVPLGLLFNSVALVWTEVYVALTAVAAWMWFLQSLGQFARDRPASYAELALLPGLGSAAARRRGLYRAVLAPPLLSLASLIGIGLLAAYLADHSAEHLLRRGFGYAVLLMYCAVGILQLLFMKRTVPVRVAMLLPSFVPLIIAPTLVGGLPIDAWSVHSPLARVFSAALLLFAVIPFCLLWIYGYGLARSPHPFLEISVPPELDN
jgi:hypothetical protein